MNSKGFDIIRFTKYNYQTKTLLDYTILKRHKDTSILFKNIAIREIWKNFFLKENFFRKNMPVGLFPTLF